MVRRASNLIRTHRRGGFTLMELLVALVMAGVVALSLVGSVRVAFQARQAAARAARSTQASAMAMEFIRQDLGGVMPPNPNWVDPTGVIVSTAAAASGTGTGTGGTGSTGGSSSSSSGNSTQLYLAGAFVGYDGSSAGTGTNNTGGNASVTFYTTAEGPLHPAGGDGEIKKVELSVDNGVLYRKVLSNLTAPQQQQIQPDQEVLCRNVRSFNLRYYDGSTWQDTWDSTQTSPANELPVAVEVTLEIDPPADDPQSVLRKYLRIIPIPCSNLINDLNASSTSSSTTGGTGQ
jgi:prepilin-type N-terminal cleavage/methylation domain-containing protein